MANLAGNEPDDGGLDALPQPSETAVPFEPGVRDDISHADYLRIAAFSASTAKRILGSSPMHADFDRRYPPPERRATTIGTATHMAILEPERLVTDVAIVPAHAPRRPSSTQRFASKPSAATIAAIEWWNDWAVYAAGKCVVTAAEFARVEAMGEAVRRHPYAADLLAEGTAEVTLQWRDGRSEIPCKARLDWRTPDHWVVDVKTCRDASPDGFRRACLTYGYPLQEAHYRTGYQHLFNRDPAGFIFIAIEADPPHGCALYNMPANAILFGLDQVEQAMLLYAQATRTGHWRSYPETVLRVPFSRFDLQTRLPDVLPSAHALTTE